METWSSSRAFAATSAIFAAYKAKSDCLVRFCLMSLQKCCNRVVYEGAVSVSDSLNLVLTPRDDCGPAQGQHWSVRRISGPSRFLVATFRIQSNHHSECSPRPYYNRLSAKGLPTSRQIHTVLSAYGRRTLRPSRRRINSNLSVGTAGGVSWLGPGQSGPSSPRLRSSARLVVSSDAPL